jgi:2-dehydro-3-deoxyphosphogluconate aldolase/(4S)-4-hydroxy-2-oxoglutarate aldolase
MSERRGPDIGEGIISAIGSAKLIPVLRMKSHEACTKLALELLTESYPIVEIAATSPQWQTTLKEAMAAFPHAFVGVGTIRSSADATLALDLGASFLVSPSIDDDLRRHCGAVLIEGGLSPTEIAQAGQSGLAKLFPAHVGGPPLLRSIQAVYPEIRIMPTGGLSLSEAPAWFEAGAFAMGVGSGLDAHGSIATTLRDCVNKLH